MRRVHIRSLDDLRTGLNKLKSNEALILGKMDASLGAKAPFVKKDWLASFLESVPGCVTRTKANLKHADGEPGLMYFDHDRKGADPAVIARMEELGGFEAALAKLDPQLAHVGFATRQSTSSGLFNSETGEEFPGSGGLHVYSTITNAADLKTYLKALVERGWLHGLSYFTIGNAGQVLERSIIDVSVSSAERIIFEAPPELAPPLKQFKREMTVRPGGMIDAKLLPDLTAAEKAEIDRRKREARAALGKPLKEAREKAVTKRVAAIVARDPKIAPERARRAAERQCEGVLLPSAMLHFADPELGEATVADVLRDPDRYIEQPMADPLEGPDYGDTTAMLFRKDSGELWIFSFAHGRTDYRIVADSGFIAESMATIEKERLAKWFVEVAADAEMSSVEESDLIAEADKMLGGGKKRALVADLKTERESRNKAQREAKSQAFTATIKRAMFTLLPDDAATAPILAEIDDVLCAIDSPEPPMRDVAGVPVDVEERAPFGDLHVLTSAGANAEEDEASRMEPPPQVTLVRQDFYSGELALQRYIAFLKTDEEGKVLYEAKPQEHVVRHHLKYRDSKMPRVKGVQTLPLVLPNGVAISRNGLHRDYGLIMRCDPKLLDMLPERAACDEDAVAAAMRFLLDDWLCDVAGDHAAKCVALAYALSVIERMIFGERPMFMVTSSQASSGKTTLLYMLVLAVLGIKPPAAAWAMSEEERRKALFSYLLQGLPTLVWDNIPNSGKVQSASLDRAATTAEYTDRMLGASSSPVAPAHTIMCFTGNNIEAVGDTASRTLEVRLLVPRSDPCNRKVRRKDPVEWTRRHRSNILAALYTVVLGNPLLDIPWTIESGKSTEQVSDGRFKMWHRMVGAALEHGSRIYADRVGLPAGETPLSFAVLFDKADEENAERIDALRDIRLLRTQWGDGEEFTASDVVFWAKGLPLENREATDFKERLQNARGEITAQRVGEVLSGLRDRPLSLECGEVLILHRRLILGVQRYSVERRILDDGI
ncbi:MAG: hypothetical protein AB7F41_04865 [Methylocystis sp.]|uniref:hypothetical protein n=2 Tax=Methylocystis sp. TaxID=1911079 RepID=UPI003D135DA0